MVLKVVAPSFKQSPSELFLQDKQTFQKKYGLKIVGRHIPRLRFSHVLLIEIIQLLYNAQRSIRQ